MSGEGYRADMERLRKIDPRDWDPKLQELVKPDERTPLENGLMRFYAHRPELAIGLSSFMGALKRNRQLPERLMELMRLRIAFHNQCRSCMAIRYRDALDDGLTEDLVCSLERPMEAPDLTEREKVAIRFGELLASDHLRIDDELYARMNELFTEGEIVEIGLYASACVGLGRWAATLHMVEELPDAFQTADVAPGALAPWGNDTVTVR
jgi:alkylhydroperoxidase family enzyme